ncbi:Barstar (barnase inhibitor) [Phytobacter palmae]|uniref:Barstar family protein n=1 Tax=Phytobacter palmae TaxID=1855371 RepID=A0ABU9V574_9ENTR|nr:Barstar (barnase inhibitor) [Phytobacter palmae]
MKMINLSVNFNDINSHSEFHEKFKRLFGFPDFYGKNFHAFIDCLTSLRIPEDGMTTVNIQQDEYILLEVIDINHLQDDLKHDFLLAIQEINNRCTLLGEKASLLLLLSKS